MDTFFFIIFNYTTRLATLKVGGLFSHLLLNRDAVAAFNARLTHLHPERQQKENCSKVEQKSFGHHLDTPLPRKVAVAIMWSRGQKASERRPKDPKNAQSSDQTWCNLRPD